MYNNCLRIHPDIVNHISKDAAVENTKSIQQLDDFMDKTTEAKLTMHIADNNRETLEIFKATLFVPVYDMKNEKSKAIELLGKLQPVFTHIGLEEESKTILNSLDLKSKPETKKEYEHIRLDPYEMVGQNRSFNTKNSKMKTHEDLVIRLLKTNRIFISLKEFKTKIDAMKQIQKLLLTKVEFLVLKKLETMYFKDVKLVFKGSTFRLIGNFIYIPTKNLSDLNTLSKDIDKALKNMVK